MVRDSRLCHEGKEQGGNLSQVIFVGFWKVNQIGEFLIRVNSYLLALFSSGWLFWDGFS